MKSTKVSTTTEAANDGNTLLAAGVFHHLGKRQKKIINLIVMDDYYILKTVWNDGSHSLNLQDDFGNIEMSLSESDFQKLLKRGFLKHEDVTMSLEAQQDKFYLDDRYAYEAMNACC